MKTEITYEDAVWEFRQELKFEYMEGGNPNPEEYVTVLTMLFGVKAEKAREDLNNY